MEESESENTSEQLTNEAAFSRVGDEAQMKLMRNNKKWTIRHSACLPGQELAPISMRNEISSNLFQKVSPQPAACQLPREPRYNSLLRQQDTATSSTTAGILLVKDRSQTYPIAVLAKAVSQQPHEGAQGPVRRRHPQDDPRRAVPVHEVRPALSINGQERQVDLQPGMSKKWEYNGKTVVQIKLTRTASTPSTSPRSPGGQVYDGKR